MSKTNQTILAMDVGNTNIHWSFITNGNIEKYHINKHNEISLLPWKEIKDRGCQVVIATVFPHITGMVKSFCEEYEIGYREIELKDQGIIKNTYTTLGIDRVCDLAASLHSFKNLKEPVVTFNFGTATTISSCDENGKFLGGIIRTGFELELKGMTSNSLSLPPVKIERECKLNELNPLNQDTENAILNGVIIGQVSLVEYYLKLFRKNTGRDPRIVITGGNSSIITKYFNKYDLFDPMLTLKGVYYCYESNLVTA